jgi:outer membrane immunogenic protein
MKKLIVGVAAALSLMTSNAVADGPYRRPPPTIAAPAYEPPPLSWTGFYIGAGVGAGAVVTDISVHDRIFDERLFDFGAGADGALGTVIIGYDWQVGPTTVFGVFADFDFFNFSHNHRVFDGPFGEFRDSHDVDNVWAVGARLGWLSSPSTLWYVTGGYTQVDIDHSPRFEDLVGVDGITVDRDRTLRGFFVGAGVDTRLAASNWFLRLEYRFSDFENGRVRIRDDVGDVDMHIDADTNAHTARLTLTYKFMGGYGWGAWGR